jgi:hypothetical protein
MCSTRTVHLPSNVLRRLTHMLHNDKIRAVLKNMILPNTNEFTYSACIGETSSVLSCLLWQRGAERGLTVGGCSVARTSLSSPWASHGHSTLSPTKLLTIGQLTNQSAQPLLLIFCLAHFPIVAAPAHPEHPASTRTDFAGQGRWSLLHVLPARHWPAWQVNECLFQFRALSGAMHLVQEQNVLSVT